MFDINTTTVQATLSGEEIRVNDEYYHIENIVVPDGFPIGFTGVYWFPHIRCYWVNGKSFDLECTQENWDKWVQPFVDQWQVEKDKHDQEVAEANSFPVRQAKALVQLNADFETVKKLAHVKSSLGFTADANSTAKENVDGLLQTIETGTEMFCDYYNQFHEVTKADLETLQSEIIKNAQNLYKQKWQYRTAIEGCTDNEGLDQVVAGIEFTYMDFTQQTE